MDVSRETSAVSDWQYSFLEGLRSFNIELEEEQLRQFQHYHQLLVAWNRRINLISRKDATRLEIAHFLDSLLIVPELQRRRPQTLIDVGTGGGFPGLPLKLALPEMNTTLVDASRKKTLFLRHFIRETQLAGVTILNIRAEALAQSHAGQFQVGVARAVAALETLIPLMLPLLRPGGIFFAYKGGDLKNEIDASKPVLAQYHASLETVHTFKLPGIQKERKILVICKHSEEK